MLLARALRRGDPRDPQARGLSLNEVALRDVTGADLEILYEHQREPEANAMVPFAPRDRAAYMEHMEKVLADPTAVTKTIVAGGRVAGSVATFLRLEKREVCYWLGREFWGQGIAARALAALLAIDRERPLYARVAKTNTRSLRVVEKCGFAVVGEDKYGDRSGGVVEEFVLRLD